MGPLFRGVGHMPTVFVVGESAHGPWALYPFMGDYMGPNCYMACCLVSFPLAYLSGAFLYLLIRSWDIWYIKGAPRDFVDVRSQDDPYPADVWKDHSIVQNGTQ